MDGSDIYRSEMDPRQQLHVLEVAWNLDRCRYALPPEVVNNVFLNVHPDFKPPSPARGISIGPTNRSLPAPIFYKDIAAAVPPPPREEEHQRFRPKHIERVHKHVVEKMMSDLFDARQVPLLPETTRDIHSVSGGIMPFNLKNRRGRSVQM